MQQNRSHAPRFVLKAMVIVFLLLMNYLMFSYTCSSIIEHITDDSSGYEWERLHELASQEKYSDLYDTLTLYDSYAEEYEGLWQACEAWHLYCQYTAAVQAAECPEAAGQADNPDYVRDCLSRAEKAREQLLEMPSDIEDQTAGLAIRKIQARLDPQDPTGPAVRPGSV